MRRTSFPAVVFATLCVLLAGTIPAAGQIDQYLVLPPGPVFAGEPIEAFWLGSWLLTYSRLDQDAEIEVGTGDEADVITVRIYATPNPLLSPIISPYLMRLNLPPLPEGVYTLRIEIYLEAPLGTPDPSPPELEGTIEVPLEIRAARAWIMAEPALRMDGDTASLRLTGTTSCPVDEEQVPVVDGSFVAVRVDLDCDAAVAPYDFVVETPPLAAGSYQLLVLDGDSARPEDAIGRGALEVLAKPVVADRFAIEVDWIDFEGKTGVGRPVRAPTEESALLWFFGPENWELMVKVLDGCGVNGHHWVYSAASTNVGYTLRVEDLETGSSWSFDNPSGSRSPAATDVAALPCSAEENAGSTASGSLAYADMPRVELPEGLPLLSGSFETWPNLPVDTMPTTLHFFGDWPCCHAPAAGGVEFDLETSTVTAFVDGPRDGITVVIPYEVELALPPLPAGDYELQIVGRNQDDPAEILSAQTRGLRVFRGIEIVTEGPLPTDEEPVVITFRGVATCPSFEVEGVELDPAKGEHLLRIGTRTAECGTENETENETEFESTVEVPLEAGRYVVELRDRDDFGLGRLLDVAQIEVVEEPTTVRDGRFRIEVDWADYVGQTGQGRPAVPPSDDAALFWFFGPENWELMVKVLDACALNGHFWVFGAATTDVEYTLRVTDTETGAEWSLTNPLGNASEAITDVEAFACGGS